MIAIFKYCIRLIERCSTDCVHAITRDSCLNFAPSLEACEYIDNSRNRKNRRQSGGLDGEGEGFSLVVSSQGVLQDLGMGSIHLAHLLLQAELHVVLLLLQDTNSLMLNLFRPQKRNLELAR